ncbi:MAG: DUF2283 domain-containing protein [Planctomycetes bacterium]|nr:DUF2283 domain-containing protein [Planctomycetota bacterium]
MKECYLEVTFRKGKPLAAYLYLPRKPQAQSARTEKAAAGILVDYGQDGTPIGLEITTPGRTTANQINQVLQKLGLRPLDPAELSPLRAA